MVAQLLCLRACAGIGQLDHLDCTGRPSCWTDPRCSRQVVCIVSLARPQAPAHAQNGMATAGLHGLGGHGRLGIAEILCWLAVRRSRLHFK